MERLQQKIENSKFHDDDGGIELCCTISQGAAVYPVHAQGEKELVHAADMALLRAKEAGRNTFLLYEPEDRSATV
jgi:GGDEF domain-containing protein